ncbi:hypothetical protein ACFLRF_04480 [Candidatus Altiarchaeota archaeon]
MIFPFPKTEEGRMQLQYTMVGIVISTLIGAAFLMGFQVGFEYGVLY